MDELNNNLVTLSVNRSYGNNEDFFRLILPDGREFTLKKIAFQRGQPLPETLLCQEKKGFNGESYYIHYVAGYVRNFYLAGFRRGDDFEFRVDRVPENPGEPYTLIDQYGIQFRLYERNTRLVAGQSVHCSFSKLESNFFSLVLSERGVALPLLSADEAVCAVGLPRESMLRRMFRELPFLDQAREELAANRASWVLTALRAIKVNIAECFVNFDIRRRHRLIELVLEATCRMALYLLEGSPFLRGTTPQRRHELQDELTSIIEAMTPYQRALEIITSNHEEAFINSLLDKLKESGFLYHPTLQFSILMLIFRHQPKRIGEKFGRIYDAIMQWNLPTWTNEPFRSAFIEQFELYIRDMRKAIDLCPQADTADEKLRVESILKALALQLCIADPDNFQHYNRNRSLYYRYVSLLRPSSSDILLDKAFRALGGYYCLSDISYNQIKEPMLMMTSAAYNTAPMATSPGLSRFVGTAADIQLFGSAISIKAHKEQANCTNLLPAGMVDWLSPEIYLSGIKRFTAATLKKIKSHRDFWNNVIHDLTLAPESVVSKDIEIIRTPPSPGDEVLIVIDSVTPDPTGNNPRFNCHIDDERFYGEGFFMRNSLVGYNMRGVERFAYTGIDGRPIHLVARVVAQHDDEYEFSLLEEVHRWIEANLWVGQEVNAVIAGFNHLTEEYSAISELGIGMLLHAPDDLPEEVTLGPQTIVRAMITQTSDREHIRARIIGLADPQVYVVKDHALSTLLHNIEYTDDIEDESNIADESENLSRETIREIVELYRMKAVGCDDVMSAYDNLCFGRVLAAIIGDRSLESELELHAELLLLHVDFADNRRVDVATLEQFRPLIRPGSLAERIFRRMEMVSWLGSHDHDQDLWLQSQQPDSELEGKFARMVLSYNMLVASSMQENDYARRIKDDISALLKVNNERISLKYYGCESQYTEFKSSLVFCANDGVKRSPEEALRKQHHEIMHIIAGFMNTTGGKLYIGVNDQHFERGLDEDFKALRLPYSPDLLKRMDELLNYLTLRVRSYFGTTTATLVDIAVDEESTKGVLIVTIKPSRQPVKLDDTIYVRLSTSTMPIVDREEIRRFVEQRALAYEDMMKMSEHDNGENEDTKPAAEAEKTIKAITPADLRSEELESENLRKRIESISVPIDAPAATEAVPVKTSLWRPNVLHSDDVNYVVPELYLYFVGDHHYIVSKHDIYVDMDPSCRLAMVICQADLDSYLVMAYKGEQLIRVPVRQLLDKTEKTNHRHWSDQPLEWACIAGENDAVLSIHADSSGALHYRATPVTMISRGSMTNAPDRILNVNVDHTPVWELIAAESLGFFEKALPDKLHTRQTGYTLRTRIDQPDCDEQIQKLLNTCNL